MTFFKAYQSGNLVLPAALLFHFKEIFSSSDDFLVWQFFYMQNTTQHGNMTPSYIADSLGKTISEVNESISRLTNQELLDMKTIEISGEIELIFDTSLALKRLDQLLSQQQKSKESIPSQVSQNPLLADFKALADDFSREFGRMLSSFELEDLRKTVVEDRVSADIIREALKEAVFNGKLNWKYINAILRNWRQDGIVSVRQIEERRAERDRIHHVEVSDELLNAMDLWS